MPSLRLPLTLAAAVMLGACSPASDGEPPAVHEAVEPQPIAVSNAEPPPHAAAVAPSGEALATIRALYEGHPWGTSPAGGADLWQADALAAWRAHGGGLVEGVDFMTANAAQTYSGLRVEPGDSSDCEAQVIVTLDNGEARDVVIYYGLINSDCDSSDGVWKIANVWRDDGWHLIERLEADAR